MVKYGKMGMFKKNLRLVKMKYSYEKMPVCRIYWKF